MTSSSVTGGHAVVVGEPLDAEQPRLQPVPAARDLIAPAHRLDQRLHGLVAGLVGEVARGQPVRVAAQAVVGGLVGEQRVEQERARAQPGRERRGDRLGGGAPHLAVGQRQPAERDVERDLLARPLAGSSPASPAEQLDLDRRGQLLEQPRPRARAGERLLGEDLLLGLGQQVLAVAARRCAGGGGRSRAPRPRAAPRRARRAAPPTPARRTAASSRSPSPAPATFCSSAPLARVGGVGREAQRRVVAGAADQLVDRGELPHRLREAGAVELAELARVALGERLRALERLVQPALDAVRRPRRRRAARGPRRSAWSSGSLDSARGGHDRSGQL